jgi:hypothetical protein
MGIETLAIVAIAATVAGAGVAAYSANEQAKSQQKMANYNASLMDSEAAQRNADARTAANAQRAQNDALRAKQRALYAKAGVVSAGTPLLVQAEQAATMELAALDIERTGNLEAARMRSQADMDRMSGRAARSAGRLQVAGTVLQGAGSSSSMYVNSKQNGAIK